MVKKRLRESQYIVMARSAKQVISDPMVKGSHNRY